MNRLHQCHHRPSANSAILTDNMTTLEDKECFPEKLFDVANENKLIFWNKKGNSITISEKKFEEEIMEVHPGFVKIPQFANFRRLAREYAFHWKIVDDECDLTLEFSHPFFIRGKKELLTNILTKRKSKRERPSARIGHLKNKPIRYRRRKNRHVHEPDSVDKFQDMHTASMRDNMTIDKITTQGFKEHSIRSSAERRSYDNYHNAPQSPVNKPNSNIIGIPHAPFPNSYNDKHSVDPTRNANVSYLNILEDPLGGGEKSLLDQPVSQVSFEDFEKIMTVYPQFFNPNDCGNGAQQIEPYHVKWMDVSDLTQQSTQIHNIGRPLDVAGLSNSDTPNDDTDSSYYSIPRNTNQTACGHCACCRILLSKTVSEIDESLYMTE